MARYDDLDTSTIALSAVVSAVVLLILILAGRAVSYAWENSAEERKSQATVYHDADNAIAQQKSVLSEFGMVEIPAEEEGQDAAKRIVIPIDRAYELIRQELSQPPNT